MEVFPKIFSNLFWQFSGLVKYYNITEVRHSLVAIRNSFADVLSSIDGDKSSTWRNFYISDPFTLAVLWFINNHLHYSTVALHYSTDAYFVTIHNIAIIKPHIIILHRELILFKIPIENILFTWRVRESNHFINIEQLMW